MDAHWYVPSLIYIQLTHSLTSQFIYPASAPVTVVTDAVSIPGASAPVTGIAPASAIVPNILDAGQVVDTFLDVPAPTTAVALAPVSVPVIHDASPAANIVLDAPVLPIYVTT